MDQRMMDPTPPTCSAHASPSPSSSGQTPTKPMQNKKAVYVGNLPENVTEDELKRVFCQFGQIRLWQKYFESAKNQKKFSSAVIKKRGVLISYSFGFVNFFEEAAAEDALRMNGQWPIGLGEPQGRQQLLIVKRAFFGKAQQQQGGEQGKGEECGKAKQVQILPEPVKGGKEGMEEEKLEEGGGQNGEANKEEGEEGEKAEQDEEEAEEEEEKEEGQGEMRVHDRIRQVLDMFNSGASLPEFCQFLRELRQQKISETEEE